MCLVQVTTYSVSFSVRGVGGWVDRKTLPKAASAGMAASAAVAEGAEEEEEVEEEEAWGWAEEEEGLEEEDEPDGVGWVGGGGRSSTTGREEKVRGLPIRWVGGWLRRRRRWLE